MKKFISFLLLLTLIMSASGCTVYELNSDIQSSTFDFNYEVTNNHKPGNSSIKPTDGTLTKPSDDNSKEPDLINCEHEYELSEVVDSTCKSEGYKTFKCIKCGNLSKELLGLGDHVGGVATCNSLAVCDICGKTYGTYIEHNWIEATCQAPKTCTICGKKTGTTIDHYCANPINHCAINECCDMCGKILRYATDHYCANPPSDCTENVYCDACGEIIRKAKDHTFDSFSSECRVCGAVNPNYEAPSQGSNAKINYSMTVFPVSIKYGSIVDASHQISGNDLILYVNMKRASYNGSGSLTGYYRISNSSFKDVATGSFSTGTLSAGDSTVVTVTIPGVITSSGTYYVYLSNYPTIY